MQLISHDQMITMVRNCEKTMVLTIGDEQFQVLDQREVAVPTPVEGNLTEPRAVEPSAEDNTNTDSVEPSAEDNTNTDSV